MPIELGRRLIAAGVVAPGEVEAALFLSVVRGQPFTRVLLDRAAISERALEEELDRVGGLALRQVVAASDLVARVPLGMCRRLAAIPVRIEALTGVVDVAAADPLDPHVSAEIAFHLGTPVRVLRAPIDAIEEAIRRLELDAPEPEERVVSRNRRATPPFPHGAPQSSIPPPAEAPSADLGRPDGRQRGEARSSPPEETPIPLVRRVEGRASLADIPAEVTRAALRGEPFPPRAILDDPTMDEASIATHRRPVIDDEATHDLAMPVSAKLIEMSRRSEPPPRISEPPPPRRSEPAQAGYERSRRSEPAPELHEPRRSEPSRPPPDPGPALRAAAAEAAFAPPRSRQPVLRRSAEELPSVRFPSQPPSFAEPPIAIPRPPPLPRGATEEHSSPKATGVGADGRRRGPTRRPTARPMLSVEIGQRTESAGILAEAIAPQLNGSASEAPPPIQEEQRVRAVLRGDPMPAEEGAAAPPRRVRPVNPGAVFDQLDAATTRDEVVKHALRGMRLAAKRVGLLAVKRDLFQGWACNVELADPEAFRRVTIPAGQPSAFATAAAAGHYLGPIRPSAAHDGLLAVVDALSADVAVTTVRVGGRPAMMLFADDLGDTMMGTRFLEELAKGVGEALTRLLAR